MLTNRRSRVHFGRGTWTPGLASRLRHWPTRGGTSGVWTLADQGAPACASRNSLAKSSSLPLDEVPTIFASEGGIGDEWVEERRQFLSTTGPRKVVGNHRPIFLEIPYGRAARPRVIKKLKVGVLSEEEWDRRNAGVGEASVAENTTKVGPVKQGNVAVAHGLVCNTCSPANRRKLIKLVNSETPVPAFAGETSVAAFCWIRELRTTRESPWKGCGY